MKWAKHKKPLVYTKQLTALTINQIRTIPSGVAMVIWNNTSVTTLRKMLQNRHAMESKLVNLSLVIGTTKHSQFFPRVFYNYSKT